MMNKKYLEAYAKYAGLVTICFEWLAVVLFFILRPDYFNGRYPLSDFASLPETRAVFSICITIAAISFWIFTSYHLPKYYKVPVRLFTASMIGYAALALTPFDPYSSVSDTIHRTLAMFFSLTFMAGIILMGKHNKEAGLRTISYAVVGLSTIIMFVFLAIPRGNPYVLLFEAVSAFIGQFWVIWISFRSFKTGAAKPQ